MHSTSARLPIAVQHQCVNQCSSKPARASTVPTAASTLSLPQCRCPSGHASAEIDPTSVQGNPLSTVQRASAQEEAPSSKVHSAIPPGEQKRPEPSETKTGWRCFPVGRGWVARHGGEPLAPRGARDEIVQVNKILPPWQPIGLDRVSRPFPPNRGA